MFKNKMFKMHNPSSILQSHSWEMYNFGKGLKL